MKARLQKLEATLPSVASTTQATSREQGAKVVKMKPRATPNRTWLAIAASLLLLLAAGWFLMRQPTFDSPAELAMANFEPYANIAKTFERGSTDDSIKADAFRAYEAGDFPTAESNFRKLPADGVHSFYLGQSLLAQQDFIGAQPIFLELTQSTFPLNRESDYYLALALVGLGRQAEAKTLLQAIIARDGHVMAAEAERLLESTLGAASTIKKPLPVRKRLFYCRQLANGH